MKHRFLFLLCLAAMLSACQPKGDTLIGTWIVDKVNVQFDEQRSTPELVKQIGEMERQNMLTISSDSTLIFKGLEESSKGRLSLKGDGTMLLDDAVFGQWKEGRIVTRTGSPLGDIVVTYRKK